MSAILDRGSLFFATVAALIAGAILNTSAPYLNTGFFLPLFLLAAGFVPGLMLLASIIGRLGSVGMLLQRDYSPLLTCVAMALAAAELPLAALLQFVPPAPAIGAAARFFSARAFLPRRAS